MDLEEKTCEGCRYFHQHYVRIRNRQYNPIQCGHCGNPRCREKKPNTPACQRFVKR